MNMFQAKMFAILKATEAIVGGHASALESYMLFVGSQTTLRTIASVWWKSRSTFACARNR